MAILGAWLGSCASNIRQDSMGSRGRLPWLLQHRSQSRLPAAADQCLL